MSSTVDSINSAINIKLSCLNEIFKIYNNYTLEDLDDSQLLTYTKELENLQDEYVFGSMDIINENRGSLDETQKKAIRIKFMRFITRENIIGRIDYYYRFCKRIHRSYKVMDNVVQNHFAVYESEHIEDEKYEKREIRCNCGNLFTINAKFSEFICSKCGQMEKMLGVIFEDEQFFYQEGQRTKHCKYDPSKHCKYWVDCIQAKENKEISVRDVNKVKACIKRDKIWLENLNCSTIRKYLKELDLTTHNDHVPLIKKIITGVEPPQFTDYELKLIYMYFSKIMEVYNRVKPPKKPNSPYHPYFIYKIVEIIIKSNQDSRKNEILNNIHLQSENTLVENDGIWKKICDEITELKYKPTGRNISI